MGESLCDQCAALCCRYFALPIDNPTTARDYDDIRWYLVHENVVVFIEKKQWYLGVMSKCKHLLDDNRCGIYETRPRVCREYSTDNCDYHGGEYEFSKLFTSAEQLAQYATEELARKKAKSKKKTGTSGKRRRRPLTIAPRGAALAVKGRAGAGVTNGTNGQLVTLGIQRIQQPRKKS